MIFGLGKKKDCYIITKTLYEQLKDQNDIYHLKNTLCGGDDKDIYTTFPTTDPLLKDHVLEGKDKDNSKHLQQEFAITEHQADELTLAKKLGCPLLISHRQVWLINVADKVGIKTEVFR